MKNEKSAEPADVPPKVKIHLGELGPRLAEAAQQNGWSLSDEIRSRLKKSFESEK